jgi:hypothetical protein
MSEPGLQSRMLRTYSRQLVTARRLAHIHRIMRAGWPDDEVRNQKEARRRTLVERVAREIIDNLLVTGAENTVAGEIKAELERRVGAPLVFEFPFMEQDLQIFRQSDGTLTRLSPEEVQEVLGSLWLVALDKVDETMI